MSQNDYSQLCTRFLQYQGAWYDPIKPQVEGYYRIFSNFRSWTLDELDAIVKEGQF